MGRQNRRYRRKQSSRLHLCCEPAWELIAGVLSTYLEMWRSRQLSLGCGGNLDSFW